MKMSKYPSIDQFRNIVKRVKDNCDYHGRSYPTMEFKGTVKLHGTNGGIGWDGKNLWCQSRNNILDINNTNSGFYTYAMQNKEYFISLLKTMIGDADSVILFGEWCGEGIQRGVALTQLGKMFVAFGVAHLHGEGMVWENHLLPQAQNSVINLYNTTMFEQFSVTVDMSNPQAVQNEIVSLVDKVEAECPVGKFFGVSGIGEGIVFSCDTGDSFWMFKAKGEKHSVSKVKKVASVDVEKLENITQFAEYAVTKNRVIQAVQETQAQSQKDTGVVTKWVMGDIAKEELDTLIENGLSMKDVQGQCCSLVRKYFFEILDQGL